MYGGRFYTFVLVLALNNKTEYDEWALPNQKALSHFIFSPWVIRSNFPHSTMTYDGLENGYLTTHIYNV